MAEGAVTPGLEQRLARRPGLSAALEGVDAALAAGFSRSKINTVVMGGINDDEIPALMDFAAERGLDYLLGAYDVKRMSGLEHYNVWSFGYTLQAFGERLAASPEDPRAAEIRAACRRLAEIYAVARQAQDAGIARLRPGVSVAEIGATIRDIGAAHGFDMPGGRYGHGIGMDYSEQPVPLNDANEHTFAAGNTIVLHSAFHLPGSGKMFVPLGDVCHVTAGGAELLMGFTRDLFVAG